MNELTGKERRLIRSIGLFQEKRKKESCFSYNNVLVPTLRKQLDSIIKQAKAMEER